MAAGTRLKLYQQFALIWSDRGANIYQNYIDTGSFLDAGTEVQPYDPDLVKAIVASGKLM